ncbi:MAG: MurR/RpiR family transcriptional regulator [Clostridiaceae bacterium]
MQNTDIFSSIHTMYNSFTNTEKKLADYILKNKAQVMYMSITDLADKANVADSSVFRFCKAMKFGGYQEFKIALAQSLNKDNSEHHVDTEILIEDSMSAMAEKVKQTNISALDETYNLLNYNEVSLAVDAMIKAEKVRFFGVGSSLITAMEGQNKFLRIMSKAECAVDAHLQSMSAALMSNREVAIVISYSGQTKDSIDVAKRAKEAGAMVICITRFIKSPLTHYADITLLCGAHEGPLQGGSLSAKISQLYLLDIIYFEYFRRTFELSKANKEKTSRAVADKLV